MDKSSKTNLYSSVWNRTKGTKSKRNSKQFNIPLNSYVKLEVKQLMPYTSILTIEYKGELVTTSIFQSNKFKSREEVNEFARELFKDPLVYARFLEIERGGKK
jgi:hypothetical protein